MLEGVRVIGVKTSLPGLTVSSFLHSHFGFYDSNEDVVEMRNQTVGAKLILCLYIQTESSLKT